MNLPCCVSNFSSSPNGHGCIDESKGSFELYHIDRCVDPDCHWRDVFLTSRTNEHTYHAFDESTNNYDDTHMISSNPFTNTISRLEKNDKDLAPADFQNDSFLSMNTRHPRRKSTAGVSVSKVQLDDRLHSKPNSGIYPPNRRFDDGRDDSHVLNSSNTSHVNVSRIKSTAKQRACSFEDQLPEPDMKKSGEETCLQQQSVGAINTVQVTRVRSQTMISNDESSTDHPRQSIIDSTIRLDIVDEERKLSGKSSKLHKHKVSVKHISSANPLTSNNEHRQLMKFKNRKISPSTVHIERASTLKKNIEPLNDTIILASIAEETAKSSETRIKSNVAVERVLRKNTAKSTSNT